MRMRGSDKCITKLFSLILPDLEAECGGLNIMNLLLCEGTMAISRHSSAITHDHYFQMQSYLDKLCLTAIRIST
jgi:hypothetical protein